MKKTLLSTFAVVALTTSSASAAMLLGFGVEADYMRPVVSGHFNYTNGPLNSQTNLDSTDNTYQVGAYFEHFVPLIPNVRVDYTPMSLTTTTTLKAQAAGMSFDLTKPATNKLQVKQLDITPYYEILDNIVSLDIGLTLRGIEAFVGTTQGLNYTDDATHAVIPMGYVAAEVILPFTGLRANADLKYIKINGNLLQDAKIKATMKLPFGLGVEAGYRYEKLKIDQFGINSDVNMKGPFAGLSYNW